MSIGWVHIQRNHCKSLLQGPSGKIFNAQIYPGHAVYATTQTLKKTARLSPCMGQTHIWRKSTILIRLWQIPCDPSWRNQQNPAEVWSPDILQGWCIPHNASSNRVHFILQIQSNISHLWCFGMVNGLFCFQTDASIFYHSSDMVLHAHSDSSYLPKFKALNSPYQKHARREKIIFLQGGKIPYEHVWLYREYYSQYLYNSLYTHVHAYRNSYHHKVENLLHALVRFFRGYYSR